jgi:hypothetical protein
VHFGLLLALLSTQALTTQISPPEIVDLQSGFALTIPEGWEQVPGDALKEVTDALGSASGSNNFVAAIGPAGREAHFAYPYALVQVVHYENGKRMLQVSREELETVVAGLTGLPASKFTSGVPDELSNLVRDASIDRCQLITTPPGFVIEATVDYEGVGEICSTTRGIIGRTNVILLHSYARADEWPQYAQTFQQLASGLRRMDDQVVTMSAASRDTASRTTRGGIDWDRVRAQAVLAVVVGAIASAVGKRAKRGKCAVRAE